MSDYRAQVGSNIALASLLRLNPQPTSPGLQVTRRVSFQDGSLVDLGVYTEWIYNVVEDATQLVTILTPLGLHTTKYRAVTIYTRDDLYVYRRYNGTAIRPIASWENYYPRNVTILIRNLELLP